MAWNGSLYLIVWSKNDTIWGQRFGSNGSTLDSSPFFIMEGYGPDVAALGSVFLVVGKNYVNSVQFVHPFAIRVDGSGTVLDASPIFLGQYYVRYISVVATNTNWFVAWQRNYTHDDPGAELMGNFVESDGTAGSEYRIIGLLTTSMYHGPKLAFDGNKIMLVYEDEVSSSTTTDIVALPILPDGTPQTTINVNQMNDDQYRPAVCFDGTNYIIAWQDSRNNISEVNMLDQRSEIFFTRMTPDGAILDGDGIDFYDTRRCEIYPALAGRAGQALLAGSIQLNGSTYGAYHIHTRLLDESDPSAIDEPTSQPDRFELLQNFPNPFNPSTTIEYTLARDSKIELTIYDSGGKVVESLFSGWQSKGRHQLRFDGHNLASGIYFYRLKTAEFTQIRKMLLVR